MQWFSVFCPLHHGFVLFCFVDLYGQTSTQRVPAVETTEKLIGPAGKAEVSRTEQVVIEVTAAERILSWSVSVIYTQRIKSILRR